MAFFISAACAVMLLTVIAATIFHAEFQKAVLVGDNGEAKVLGLLTVRGAAFVVLCGLFIGGMLYPLQFSEKRKIELNWSYSHNGKFYQCKVNDIRVGEELDCTEYGGCIKEGNINACKSKFGTAIFGY